LLGIALTFLATWAMQSLYTLTSTFLAAAPPLGAGYGAARAGRLMLGVTLVAGVAGPVATGVLLDRVFRGNAKLPLLAGFALMSTCVYALRFPAVTGNPLVLEMVLVAAGFGVQFALPAIYYFIAHAYPPAMAGKMTGLWTGLGASGGVLGVYLAGLTVRSRNTYDVTFTVQAVVALAAFLLTFALTEASGRCGGRPAASE
jgi:DHA2 family methylenomycin A resistance protein-like MFS transporter